MLPGVAASRVLSAIVYPKAPAQHPFVGAAVAFTILLTGSLSVAGPVRWALRLDPADLLREQSRSGLFSSIELFSSLVRRKACDPAVTMFGEPRQSTESGHLRGGGSAGRPSDVLAPDLNESTSDLEDTWNPLLI